MQRMLQEAKSSRHYIHYLLNEKDKNTPSVCDTDFLILLLTHSRGGLLNLTQIAKWILLKQRLRVYIFKQLIKYADRFVSFLLKKK